MWELLLANLPIVACFLLGLGLLIVEVFMPGFGLPGFGAGPPSRGLRFPFPSRSSFLFIGGYRGRTHKNCPIQIR